MTGCRDCEMSKTSLAEIEAMVKRLLVAHEEAEVIAAQLRMKTVMTAFPAGVDEHAAVHVALAKAARAQEEFYSAIKLDLAKNGVWALVKIICVLIIVGIAGKLGLHFGL